MIQVGQIREITRYPVKTMAGVRCDAAFMGWHGLHGDRRFAFRRMQDNSGFPWLTASKLPELLLYKPIGGDDGDGEPIPTHIQTPSGSQFEIGSDELNAEVSRRFGSDVELIHLKHGIFDEATISVISLATIAAIARAAGVEELDRRRFRANVVIETEAAEAFLEDGWVGGTLIFGSDDHSPAVTVTMRDERCVMVNLDPDTSEKDARVMKAVVRLNENYAGVYATVVQTGTIRVGGRVSLIKDVK